MPQPFDITYLLVAGNREYNLRYHAEVLAAAKHAGLRVETLVAETNQPAHPDVLRLADQHFDLRSTPWIAPAHRVAVANASAPLYLYTCNHHMTFRRHTWLQELLEPLHNGATGSGNVIPHGFGPAALQFSHLNDADPAFRVHLQGGLWAARVADLRAADPTDHPVFPHGYEDVVRSWRLVELGYKLAHVPTIFSTGAKCYVCPHDEQFSVIHDYRSES